MKLYITKEITIDEIVLLSRFISRFALFHVLYTSFKLFRPISSPGYDRFETRMPIVSL